MGLPSALRLMGCALRHRSVVLPKLGAAAEQLEAGPRDGPDNSADPSSADADRGAHLDLVSCHLPAILDALAPGPASLLLLLALLPAPLSDAEISLCTSGSCSSPATTPAPGGSSRGLQHPCQLSMDMCALYDHCLLHFCLLGRRHQVDPAVAAVLRQALMQDGEPVPGRQGRTSGAPWLERLRWARGTS